jgi:protein-disulfide isomerase
MSVEHSIGPEDAPVTLIEYGDFECPNCKQAAPAVKLLLEHFTGKIRFIFRNFPVKERHPHAVDAAEAAESAGSQGKFWAMHDLLFDNQLKLEAEDLRRYAQSLDLDLARYSADVTNHAHLPKISQDIRHGLEGGVRGTPGFFINGQFQDVSFGIRQLFDRVAQLLPEGTS